MSQKQKLDDQHQVELKSVDKHRISFVLSNFENGDIVAEIVVDRKWTMTSVVSKYQKLNEVPYQDDRLLDIISKYGETGSGTQLIKDIGECLLTYFYNLDTGE